MTLYETQEAPHKAVLVGLQLPRMTEAEVNASLDELSRLVTTLGYEVIGRSHQKRNSTKTAGVLGDGKLKELAKWTDGTGVIAKSFIAKKHKAALKFAKNQSPAEDDDSFGDSEDDLDLEASAEVFEDEVEQAYEEDRPTGQADVVVFDCDLSPSQLRNLESATGAIVLDRTGVIIEIFSRHARTKAAKAQVEIARLTYVAPRLRESSRGGDRQGGGIGGKGAGETALELDRRKIRDRIKELKQELSAYGKEDQTRRSRREQEITVALVGYTNAGKSSLMRALTGSDVLIADKLFATLDTTVREMHPETKPKILISDTVGFIKKLPHDLVASFKSTLDEAAGASLLLYVVDASDEFFRSQLEVTKTVLAEVGAGAIPFKLVFNKRDKLSDDQQIALQNEFPEAIFISTRDERDIQGLQQIMIAFFESSMSDKTLLIPYDVQGAIGEIRNKLKVLKEEYTDRGLELTVRGEDADFQKLKKKYGLR